MRGYGRHVIPPGMDFSSWVGYSVRIRSFGLPSIQIYIVMYSIYICNGTAHSIIICSMQRPVLSSCIEHGRPPTMDIHQLGLLRMDSG